MAISSTFNNPLSPSTSDMANQATSKAHDAVDRAAEGLKPAINKLASAAHSTIDRVAEKAVPAAEWAQTTTQHASDSTLRLVDQCGSAVRARPLISIAAAVAIGYFVGRVTR